MKQSGEGTVYSHHVISSPNHTMLYFVLLGHMLIDVHILKITRETFYTEQASKLAT